MPLPNDLKPLYIQWLQELLDKLDVRQEQLSNTYTKAKKNLEDAEGIFYHPNDLKRVKGIGNTIMKRLERKLENHCKELGCPLPDQYVSMNTINTDGQLNRPAKALRNSTTITTSGSSSKESNDEEQIQRKKNGTIRKPRKYIPKKNSGGYAILLSLLENKAIRRGITKDNIISTGQKYSTHSMTPNFSTRELHSAWSSINSLLKHELVFEEGRPKKYTLTEKGLDLAKMLKVADKIVFDNENNENHSNQDGSNSSFTSVELTADLSALENSVHNPLNRDRHANNNENTLDETNFTFNISKSSPQMVSGTPIKRNRSLIDSSPIKNKRSLNDSSPIAKRSKTFPTETLNSNRSHTIRKRFAGISYELWPHDTYEIYPILDHREIKSQKDRDFFMNALLRKGMKSECKQLSLGDIVWVASNKRTNAKCLLNTIIERKRLDDLAYSIRDNRFMEQKIRLEKSACPNKYYLIEETMGSSVANMGEALKTALWNILVYARFSIIRTHNSDDTVEELFALQKVITRQYAGKDLIVVYPYELTKQEDFGNILHKFRGEFEKNKNIQCCQDFETFQDIMGKGDSRTIGELTINILMFVKGVSLEKAVTIQSKFPTLYHILNAYKRCRSEQEAQLLMFTHFKDAPGNKKITKSLSEKISQVFHT
ncbi:hypothetical protein TBLA_0A02580 [Henningerozyma blattae CBS 6284]|uniref:Crossover junction endonuclease MUS81 n=1 Tax=Henningerozyma blattae (strain ATCC 34711 / CBS 6284 / DSM 70876 / NBRC 10599 / NRRL Y-10934 / UCD 77-7) TaxID=1071380 RepID=I2GVA5_HENB6|nr:hypothetical protein TBLA_0A02580 [Tetrapisispora blattae CBS 6284]CCH58057.1 hypothetical protein TBLA_0A02580 [Tetrapisispora blattae CBS 6284]